MWAIYIFYSENPGPWDENFFLILRILKTKLKKNMNFALIYGIFAAWLKKMFLFNKAWSCIEWDYSIH